MSQSLLYLGVNAFCLFGPLILSFDKKVAFYKTWKAFIPACLLTLLVFILWDIAFTDIGVWGFNPEYLVGIDIFNLPLEEWLFFITIPYACVFTYEVLKVRLPKFKLSAVWTKRVAYLIILFSLIMIVLNPEKLYTASAFLFLLILTLKHRFLFKKDYLGNFYPAYLVLLIPFIIANGVLTGITFWEYPIVFTDLAGLKDQIVWYNNEENIALRIFSVPFEDIWYGMGLILMNVTLFEHFRGGEGKIRLRKN
jgi:lycopene cyclase domain-containing protein